MTAKVTSMELFWRGACRADRRLFKKTFGRSAEVTLENMKTALRAGLCVHYYITECAPPGNKTAQLRDLFWQARKELGPHAYLYSR